LISLFTCEEGRQRPRKVWWETLESDIIYKSLTKEINVNRKIEEIEFME